MGLFSIVAYLSVLYVYLHKHANASSNFEVQATNSYYISVLSS